jgi:hypothetical protein
MPLVLEDKPQRAGVLNRRVQIQKQVKDPITGKTKFINFTRAWVGFSAQLATETPGSAASSGGTYLKPPDILAESVQMRFQRGINPRMRILYGQRTLEIVGVVDVNEKHNVLVMAVREVI